MAPDRGVDGDVGPGRAAAHVGIGLGPHGINLLTAASLSSLDPVVPVALAALGVLVGLGSAIGASVKGAGSPPVYGRRSLTLSVVSFGIALLTIAATWLAVPQSSAVVLVMGSARRRR